MSTCAYAAWWFLPIEQRRRLRLIYMLPVAELEDINASAVQRLRGDARRLDHLTDRAPRCSTCRQENT